MRGKDINIPLALLQRLAKQKRFDEITCAYIVKCNYVNSVMYDSSIENIVKVFGVCKQTATRPQKLMRNSDLFRYNEKLGSLEALSFKTKEVQTFRKGKKSYQAKAEFCIKAPLDIKGKRFKEVRQNLRDLLLLQAIDAPREKSLNKMVRHREESFSGVPTFLSEYAEILGCDISTVSRYMERLVKAGRLTKKKVDIKLAIPEYTPEKMQQWKSTHKGAYIFVVKSDKYHNLWCWVINGYIYTAISEEDRERFKFVIYNHKKRIATRFVKQGQTNIALALACHDNFYSPFSKASGC